MATYRLYKKKESDLLACFRSDNNPDLVKYYDDKSDYIFVCEGDLLSVTQKILLLEFKTNVIYN